MSELQKILRLLCAVATLLAAVIGVMLSAQHGLDDGGLAFAAAAFFATVNGMLS